MGKKKVEKSSETLELKDVVSELLILGKVTPVVYRDDSTELMGLFLPHSQEIEIRVSELYYEVQLSTLLHEVIEALDTSLELDMDHNQITAMEAGIFQVLRDNPVLCEAFLANKGGD